MRNFMKGSAFKGLVFVALFLLGMMIYAGTSGGVSTIPETLTGAIVTPIQSLGARISDGFYSFIGYFTDSGSLRKENDALQAEINELRKNQVELDRLRFENESYRQFLNLKEHHNDFQLAHGRVIGRDYLERYGDFTIDIGSLDGVKVDDPVVSGDNLVGVVRSVGPKYANVESILNPNTQASVFVSRVDVKGVMAGSYQPAADNQIRMNYLTKDSAAMVNKGDMVVTSGQGGLFPAELMIGTVADVVADTNGVSWLALIDPYADVMNLSNVMVITGFGDQVAGDQAGE